MNCKKIICLILSLSMIFIAAGCSDTASEPSAEEDTTAANVSVPIDSDSVFTDNDLKTDYDGATAISVDLADGASSSSSSSVTVDGNTVTVKAEGTYIFSGKLSDGNVVIDSTKDSKIRIILSNTEINSSDTAPIYVKQADKVFITAEEGTLNSLSVSGEYVNSGEDNIDAAIFSKDDLTLNGGGTLNINASYGHGIVSKDDLNVTGGIYNITAASHGISGKDCLCIADGTFTVDSGKDALHAENNDDTSLGYVYIGGGNFSIDSDGDGISSSLYTQIEGGKFSITCGGGSVNGSVSASDFRDMFGGFPGSSSDSSDEDTVSAKAIKSGGALYITNGEFSIDSADDAIHSNTDVIVTGGNFTIKTGDDGFHADSATSVHGGNITVSESYEGIEGQSIEISGGSIALNTSDDGLNAAGGNDESGVGGFGGQNDIFAVDENAFVRISGGKLIVDADGDGIDSNGTLEVTGGETYVAGPENSGNGALDYASDATVSGGIFIATGASGMASNFSDSSTQGAAMINLSSYETEKVEILDEDGNVLASFSPNKTYSNVVVSCPEMKKGNSYTINCGTSSNEITLTSTVYGSSGGMGGMGGNPMGGGRPGGGKMR